MRPQQPAVAHPPAEGVPVDPAGQVGGAGDAVRTEQCDEVTGHAATVTGEAGVHAAPDGLWTRAPAVESQ